jgi:hypothetical protein
MPTPMLTPPHRLLLAALSLGSAFNTAAPAEDRNTA